jgi:conjugal transfer pilin signal peptidase TrbI
MPAMRLIFTRSRRCLAARLLERLRLGPILRRQGRWWLLGIGLAIAFQARFSIGINLSESLPERVFLIDHRSEPKRGDLVAFRWSAAQRLPRGTVLIKILAGMPGDEVTLEHGQIRLNGAPMGTVLTRDRQGAALEAGPTGRLPEDAHFVHAPHPRSLDSRYAQPGWVSRSQFLGRAHAIL